jgi:hypothetical protein
MKNMPHPNSASISIPIEKLGPPGVLTQLHVVPVFSDDRRNDDERLQDNTSRSFRVTCKLTKDVEVQHDIKFNFAEDSGDSFLAIPDRVIALEVKTFDGKFVFNRNEKGRLSSIRFECIAKSHIEARKLFQKIVGPSLDHLSFVANSPLHTPQITIVDELHQIVSTEIVAPHSVVTLNPGTGTVYARLMPVYAMYREAKNSVSPFYKFFCLYKILEGLLKPLQSRLYEEAKRKGIVIPSFKARVPDYSDISEDQKSYVGKSIKQFFDEFLTTQYRNSVAHFISDEGAVLNVNEMEGIQRYHSVIHLTDLCCREVILHFESCIKVLEESGR